MIRRIKKRRELLKLNDFLNGLEKITYDTKYVSYHSHGVIMLYNDYSRRNLHIKQVIFDSVQLDYDLICTVIKSKYHLGNYAVRIIV